MNTAAIVLGLAALGGATLAGIRLSGKPRPPTWLALVHGVVAATGLVLLAYEVYTYSVPVATQIALGILVLAAVGGLTLFLGFHMKERDLPIPLVLGHGLTAVVGYVTLLLSMGNVI